MASEKTEATELAVGFGILGVDPATAVYADVADRFEGTLTENKFATFQDTYRRNTDLARPIETLWFLGDRLREEHPELFPARLTVRWLGGVQQAGTVRGAKDLEVGTTVISVKADSRVVMNCSPTNLFVQLPQGELTSTVGDDWFILTAHDEFQALFELVNGVTEYSSVADFMTKTSRAEKKVLGLVCQVLQGAQAQEFQRRYVSMCRVAANVSAAMFTAYLQKTLATNRAGALREQVLGHFLRLDSTRYILAGLEGREPFAVLIPSLTEWRSHFELATIIAEPDLQAEQGKVKFFLSVKGRSGAVQEVPYHAEIRWSHGKFCGNPEAKLYRDFPRWDMAPGFGKLV